MTTARLVFGALMVAACGRPAIAQGLSLAVPPDAAVLLNELEVATTAPVPTTGSPGANLNPLLDASGNFVVLENTDGAYGGAFTDADGNTIVSYQLSFRTSQGDTANATLDGTPPAQLPAYADAVAFLRLVAQITAAQGRSLSQVYVTGFSEGGDLASYVGQQTGVSGVSFGASGLPGYSAAGNPANNFIAFVEAGDPIAQYGTDTLEQASAVTENTHFDHYGTVVLLEAPPTDIENLAAGLAGHTLPSLLDGTSGVPQDEYNAGFAIEGALQTRYHNYNLYFADTTAFAQQYGY